MTPALEGVALVGCVLLSSHLFLAQFSDSPSRD